MQIFSNEKLCFNKVYDYLRLYCQKTAVLLFIITFSLFTITDVVAEYSNENISKSNVRFSVIVTSQSASSKEVMLVSGGEWFTSRQLVQTAVLIEHPLGNILWDTGVGTEIESQMEIFSFFEKEIYTIENVNPAINQLNEHNYPISSIQAIIPSHLHWDHASAIEDFPETPVWIQKKEYETAQNGKPPVYVRSQYDSPDIKWQEILLNNTEYEGFSQSLDIYNDGSLVLVNLPGHSSGHLGLFINTTSKERYLFIGDTTWTLKGITNNVGRPSFTQWLLDTDEDKDKNKTTINLISNLKKAQPSLKIVPAHDELVTSTLAIFPNFQ
jgi:glyoxylase-like metal-dependent hydrolase (beta-lactamase superfamily II)